MSKTKNGPGTGGKPRRDVLASLKMASMEDVSRAALPAEILSSVFDYLSPVDLIRVARSSKLLCEIAYDDTRWVQKMKKMGCWNEIEARKRVEHVYGTIVDPKSVEKQELAEQGKGTSAAIGDVEGSTASAMKSISDGFDQINVSTTAPVDTQELERDPVLGALKLVKSVRGEARQEYGKVHAALSPFYEDIVTFGPSTKNLVFQKYNDPHHQSQILSQLQAFSNCDNNESWRERIARLQEAVSLFETAALKEFRQGYETEDIDGTMKKYSHVLCTLNGGGSAVEYFIHHNHMVTRKSEFARVADCIDPVTSRVKLQQTQVFFTRLSVAYNEEVSIINRIFPPPTKVASPFVEKVGQDVLYPFLTAIFDELHRSNIESYLNAVSVTFAQCQNLSETLLPIQNAPDSFDEFLDSVITKVYEPHMDLYLAEELDHFRKWSDSAVGEWDRQLDEQAASTESFLMSNVNRQADKRDFLSSFKKVIMAPVNILPSFSGNKSNETKSDQDSTAGDVSSLKSPNRFSTIASPAPVTVTEAPTSELAAKAALMKSKMEGIRSLFSIEVALSMVHAAKSSLERAAQFVRIGGQTGAAAKQQCQAIFVTLLRILGHRHVIVGFNRAVDHLSNYRPREQGERDQSGVEPLVTFLELVNVGDLILQMVDVFYEQELVSSKLTDRNDFLDPAVKEKKKFEQMLDERVATGLSKGIDVLMEEVDYILATRQLATDFNPGISNDPYRQTMNVGVTEAASAVVDVVSSHTQMLVGSTDKSTLDVFNQEVGLRLFAALCKHLKRQRISIEGSLRLISDMNHYFKFVQTLRNSNLLLYFKAFRELSQIYLIDPSDAKELATIIADAGRFQGIWRVEEVYEFAERRADWYQVKRDVERAMYGIGCTVM
ncbi:exocyst complex component Sec10 family protein [Aspergillus chevalieri]|uniref:F-box protein: endocytic membrane traffic, recycling ReCYcling 1 n=1 Tax=Aspergillus chevalieri TaxID=182096 RepID=A0A7R7VIM7_ASPCH|nr:F-box protein: endocytic membrane traffic, recycling ReCYcling 1 [Aspergillus chevalieri]BCR84474.1 F-box protein: endocytic membrane traffic, recycling ReCYcling 1 [Aspergillus chevalieri]